MPRRRSSNAPLSVMVMERCASAAKEEHTRYIIHRGQHEIGGMCIEVAADDGTRILLDLGMLCIPRKPNARSAASRTVIPREGEHLGAKRRVCCAKVDVLFAFRSTAGPAAGLSCVTILP